MIRTYRTHDILMIMDALIKSFNDEQAEVIQHDGY